ncbi:helix-turn-helix domain-containing protein [Bacteroides sp.]|uniref:LexA family transcriptional regulator n=1 Tax=Bacteroides sp. TaxID=29523 RepID=UPI0026019B91|nr:helix-turn-helix domain-containing protein [Bacteroides sp.]MDD3040149.1 S24 family peptidase [Bacteroides sp.]
MILADKLKKLLEEKEVTAYKIWRDTGIAKQSIMRYMNGTAKPSGDNLHLLAKYFNVPTDVLINDDIDLDSLFSKERSTIHYDDLKGKAIPHIDIVTASCGLPNGFNSAIMKGDCERFIIPDMPGCDFTIRAGGRSMINRNIPERSINDRDIVGCRIITTRSHVRWGEVYALATQDGIMIKRIEESDKEGCIKCVPFNNEEGFKSYDVPVNEIYDWALVVGVVSVKTWI